MQKVPEKLLHHIWKFKLFDLDNIYTTGNNPLKIGLINIGESNINTGPDFVNAQIKIGDILWAGHIEIHWKSSDWKHHKHEDNPHYNNVVLHVVYEDDMPISTQNGVPIPTLELKDRIDLSILENYEQLFNNDYWIPCQKLTKSLPKERWYWWLNRLAIERIEYKIKPMKEWLELFKNDWQQVFYTSLLRTMGGKVNNDGMELLAKNLPYTILQKHRQNRIQLEALLQGQAGFLEDVEEEYPLKLKKEYDFLAHKYQLKSLPITAWKFFRMRPANYPTIRLAQIAALMTKYTSIFQKVLDLDQVKDIEDLLEVEVSSYWNHHYHFGKRHEASKAKRIGKTMLHSILINTILPIRFFYGKMRGIDTYCQSTIAWFESLKAEQNTIIQQWDELGINARHAADTQALLHLKREYCDQQSCLNCSIGHHLLKQ